MIVRARAPLRLGLAGGGTDVSPYAERHGGAVMNATIGKSVHAWLRPRSDDTVVLTAHDIDVRAQYPATAVLPRDGRLDLLTGVYDRVVRDFRGGRPLPLSIATHAEAPAGSGLGTSSTLVVALLAAFAELLALPLGEDDLARLAHSIEREDLALAGGRQDHYAAAFGGFNFMEFGPGPRVLINPLRLKPRVVLELEARILLCFTGVSRASAEIIARQSAHAASAAAAPLEAMHRTRAAATGMKEALLRGELDAAAAVLRAGWDAKRGMAEGIATGPIEALLDAAMAAGAEAGKVSGAGGGGFLMLFVPPERRRAVTDALTAAGGAVEGCRFDGQGAVSWRA